MASSDLMQPAKLGKLVSLGFKKMKGYLPGRMLMLNQYVGRFYGKEVASEGAAFPMNMMHQATTTLVPNLAYKNPKADVSSRFVEYENYASTAALAMDNLVEEIRLKATMRMIVTDAIFLAGFSKTGLAISGQTLDIDGYTHDIGQPYCDRVDPDDMVLDPVARQWEEQRFMGNRFRADLSTLQDSGMYDPDQLSQLSSRYEDYGSDKLAGSLSGGKYSEAEGIAKAVDLVELWLPGQNVIVTMPWLPGDEVGGQFLNMVDYEGPEAGPYNMLGFAMVPDNILPVAPAMVWYDLSIMANKMARKAARQAERQKSVLVYESSGWEDAQEIVDSMDGESVRVDNIDAIKEVSYGGVNDDAYQYIEWAKRQFSEMAMNVDLLSGAKSNEATLGQAEMVQANGSIRIGDMQSMVYDFVADAMKQLFFFLHTDPLIELPLVKRVSGQDEQVAYTPEMREGDWLDYNIKVRPYSMARQDPNVKVRRVIEFCGSVIPAIAQAYQMLGPAFNIEATIVMIGREMGIEDLGEIINSPILHAQVQRMKQVLEAGIPVDQKVIQSIMGVAGGMGAGGGGRPQQPNPGQMVAAGITPAVEHNQGLQETSGELQAAAAR